METVTLSSKGQIVIPKALRDANHLDAGAEFIVSFAEGEIRLLPLPVYPPTRVEDGLGALARKNRSPLDEAQTEATIAALLLDDDTASKS